MSLAVDVARAILGGPADFQQRLLEIAAFAGVHHDRVVVDARPDHRCDLLAPQHFGEDCPVGAHEDEPVHGMLVEPQPAVARHRLGDVDEHRMRDGVPAVPEQCVDDRLGVVAGGTGVPQSERRQPVGVDVLGCPLELGERRDLATRVLGGRVVHLEEEGFVRLDDERAVGHEVHSLVERRRRLTRTQERVEAGMCPPLSPRRTIGYPGRTRWPGTRGISGGSKVSDHEQAPPGPRRSARS